MGFFRRYIKTKPSLLKDLHDSKPVILENLEQRILLSGDSLSGFADDLSQKALYDNTLSPNGGREFNNIRITF